MYYANKETIIYIEVEIAYDMLEKHKHNTMSESSCCLLTAQI